MIILVACAFYLIGRLWGVINPSVYDSVSFLTISILLPFSIGYISVISFLDTDNKIYNYFRRATSILVIILDVMLVLTLWGIVNFNSVLVLVLFVELIICSIGLTVFHKLSVAEKILNNGKKDVTSSTGNDIDSSGINEGSASLEVKNVMMDSENKDAVKSVNMDNVISANNNTEAKRVNMDELMSNNKSNQ